jgi:hypothetical protein
MSHDDAVPEVDRSAAPDVDELSDADTQPAKDLLAEHVPLALIVDLVNPEATSAEILESEGLPDVAWWDESDGSDAPATPQKPSTDPQS